MNNELDKNEMQPQTELTSSSEDVLKDIVSKEKEDKQKAENNKDKKKTKKEHKVIKHGLMSTALTVIFVAVVVLINVVATMLFDKFPMTIDLTKNKSYSISEESEKYAKKIDTDVLITVFAKEDDFK
ncbi:MAG: hypothetical protein ACI4RN_01150, partial [Oscillospiraceae bacterium]